MVYQDLSTENSSSSGSNSLPPLAPVQDRFLAFAFDVALCFPVLFIALKPLWRKIQFLSVTSLDSTELKVLLVLMGLFSVLIFVAFSAFCVSRWGATPGKRVLQVQVISTNGSPITFGRAAFRSLVWTFEFLLMGLPFLEVLSHSKRRPWHDRLAETLVVSEKKIASEAPHWIEQHFFRNIYWAMFSVLAITVGLEVRGLLMDSLHGEMKRQELLEDGYLCSNLSEAFEGTKEDSRLDLGLGLFLIGQLGSECLESELDFALWSQNPNETPWAHLAQGFLSEAAGNEAEPEFQKACPDEKSETPPCAVVRWKRHGQTNEVLKATWLYKIGHLKELILEGKFDELKKHIDSSKWPTALHSYVQSKYLQGVWLRKEEQAFVEAFSVLTAGWNHDLRLEMGSWSCLAHLTSACRAETVSPVCQVLSDEIKSSSVTAWPRPVALAMARESTCRNRVDREVQDQFTKAFLRSSETAWVQELLEDRSLDDVSWKRVSEAMVGLAPDDWLYGQGLWYLSKGAVTRERREKLNSLLGEKGSEDFFWWMAKFNLQDIEKINPQKKIPELKLRLPTSQAVENP